MPVRAGTPAALTRSRLASEHRAAHPDAGRIEALRQQLRFEQLAEHIAAESAREPSFTSRQRAQLAALLTITPSSPAVTAVRHVAAVNVTGGTR